MKKIRRLVCVGLIGGLVLLSVGCAGDKKTEVDTKEKAKTEEKAKDEVRVIGKESKDANKIGFKNNIGKDIKKLEITKTGETESLMSTDLSTEPIKNGESVVLYFTANEEEATGSKDEVKFNTTYDVSLVTSDDKSYTIYNFGFEDIESADINYVDDVVYLVYKSKATGEEINTKEAQLAKKLQIEAEQKALADKQAAEAAANAQAAAANAQAAAEQAAAAAQAQPEVSTPEPTAPAQSEDQCLDGGTVEWN